MVLEQKIIGARVFYIDRKDNLLFTKSELKAARDRYQREYAKSIAKSG